jgi:eukaryotic-like serine/threonine-protein kinase
LGSFRIVGLLGKGGMGAVYEAHDPQLDRLIALKVLPPEFLHDGTFEKRFEREAKMIARLEHPNIVPIYASGIDEAVPWMSMRLLAGGNLGTLLEHRRVTSQEAVRMLRSVADALDYAHARGVVHRDIKPTNLLLDDSRGVCIADFGLAQMLEGDAHVTRTGTLIGTPHYMAPEQARGDPLDHRSDIYSLGIVAYEMFVGSIPFKADSPIAVLMKHLNEPLPTPPDGVTSRSVVEAIRKAVAKDPAQRWSSAGAFVAALEAAAAAPVSSFDREATDATNHHSLGRSLRWAGAAAGALTAAAGLTWWIAGEPTAPPRSLAAVAAAPPVELGPAVPGEPVTRAPIDPQSRALAPVANRRESRDTPEPPAPQLQNPPVAEKSTLPSSTLTSVDVAPLQAAPGPLPVTRVDTPAAADNSSPAPTPAIITADIVTPPVRVRTVSAAYPAPARAAGLEGDVLLQAVVGTDGKIRNVTVLRSVHPLVDEAAKKAVLQYQYVPGQRNGVPEAVVIRLTVSFRLR